MCLKVNLWLILLTWLVPTVIDAQQPTSRGITPLSADVRSLQGFDAAHSVGLFVGIRQFEDPPMAEVPYAVDDAIDLAYLFALELNLISPQRTHLCLAGSPQKPESQKRLDLLLEEGAQRHSAERTEIYRQMGTRGRKTGDNGLLVVFFATHGFQHEGLDFLATQDSYHVRIRETSIGVSEIFDDMGQTKSPRRLLLLDACRERLIKSRGNFNRGTAMSATFARAIADVSGLVVLAGTTTGGFAYEDDQRKNGVFTAGLLRGLRGKAEVDERYFITVQTLAEFTNEWVRDWVAIHRPGQINEGITIKMEGSLARMPLAMDPAGLLAVRNYQRRRDEALAKLRANIGQVITGTMYDDMVRFLSGEADTARLKLIENLEGLDGSPKSQQSTAYFWENQLYFGTEIDTAEALKFLEQAIGLYSGTGGRIDLGEAKNRFEKAAAIGGPLATMWLARCYHQGRAGFPKDGDHALRLANLAIIDIKRLAESGQVMAAFLLGAAYSEGLHLEPNMTAAVFWYRKAANAGSSIAQNNLGLCYQDGKGVSKDGRETVSLYRKAAEQGLANALNNLGFCYQYGIGVGKDEKAAISWYRKAAEQGFANAQDNLGYCYQYGVGVAKDEKAAVTWYRKAAEQGLALGQRNLGVCYLNGMGVAKNENLAVMWLQRAALQGDSPAQETLTNLGKTW